MAKRMGKEPVRVDVEANRLRLDPERWREFWSVFPHLLRNAVDHGLEGAEQCRAAGKSETAVISLITQLTDQELRIQVSDSGAGIDWCNVEKIARDRGLPCDTQQELNAVLFEDGVSTKGQVTDTSGRGVGTSAVKRAVETLGGTIAVTSIAPQGCCFTMTWPASAAVSEPPVFSAEREPNAGR
jgi:chemotaxis protein histidine kinase CheA